MPDDWERQHGLNARKCADANQITDGYTNLEKYLNSLTRDRGGTFSTR